VTTDKIEVLEKQLSKLSAPDVEMKRLISKYYKKQYPILQADIKTENSKRKEL